MAQGKIKNWGEFQHYKDRSPPWIKLHRSFLDNYEFACLPLASKALAPLLWLLAAESSDGSVRIDPEWLAFRLRWPVADVVAGLKPLCDGGFIEVASDALAGRLQEACLETETETEGEHSCASADADAPPGKSDPIPYQAIVDLFNGTLTGLAKVRELTAKRRTLIRTAWNASPQRRTRKFWTAYFAECQDDDFLNGTGPYSGPHANWRPTFDYLLRAEVVTRVFEQAMDRVDREAA